MSVEVVRPSGSSLESWLVAGVVALLLAATGVAVNARHVEDTSTKLFDWQISSFSDLNAADQAVYTALTAATTDLWWQHTRIVNIGSDEMKKDPWPTMAQLQDELLIEPFVQDAAWVKLGSIQWQRVASFSFEGSTVYYGAHGKLPGQSAYLLLLSHVHKGAGFVNGATVWVHRDSDVTRPSTVVRDSLILGGWKEVVPYSGAAEVERLKGTS